MLSARALGVNRLSRRRLGLPTRTLESRDWSIAAKSFSSVIRDSSGNRWDGSVRAVEIKPELSTTNLRETGARGRVANCQLQLRRQEVRSGYDQEGRLRAEIKPSLAALVRPLSHPFPPYGLRPLPAQFRRPWPRSATRALRQLRSYLTEGFLDLNDNSADLIRRRLHAGRLESPIHTPTTDVQSHRDIGHRASGFEEFHGLISLEPR